MKNIYVLTLKTTGETTYYTTLAAICKLNSYDVLRVTQNYLYKVFAKENAYESPRIKIVRTVLYNSNDEKLI